MVAHHIPATYTYNNKNQLIGATTAGKTVANTFNAEGLRATKVADGVTKSYCYEYDRVIKELDSTGSVAYNIYGTNLISRQVDGQKVYYLYNGHGDVTAMLAPNGNIVASYYYDAFGVIVEQSGNFSNPYRYAGYIYDEEITLYNLKARYYDAGIARFLQEDTYLGDKNDPLSLNLYTYCKNEPLKYYDPSGHNVAVRATFEGMGWKVDYNPNSTDRRIVITNPNTGQFYGITTSEYTYVNGSATITTAFFNKIKDALTPASSGSGGGSGGSGGGSNSSGGGSNSSGGGSSGSGGSGGTGTGNQSGSGTAKDKTTALINSPSQSTVISNSNYSSQSLRVFTDGQIYSLSELSDLYVYETKQDGFWRILLKLHDKNGPLIAELSDQDEYDDLGGRIYRGKGGITVTKYSSSMITAMGSDMNKLLDLVITAQTETQEHSKNHGVWGVGIKIGIGLAFYASAQFYYVSDKYNNQAVVFFTTAGGGMAVDIGGSGFYFPNMDNIYELNFQGLSISVGAGVISGSVQISGREIGGGVALGPNLNPFGPPPKIMVGFSADATFYTKFLWDSPSDSFKNR